MRRRRHDPLVSILTALPALALLLPLALSADVLIATRGRAAASVVVDAAAGPVERKAAEELAFFLHIVTGADFPIVSEAPAAASRLLVGEGAARAADPGFRAASLAPEEIVVRSAGRDLILAGGSPRGTIYAVYAFLEDVVGCRWWTAQASTLPRRPTLEIGPTSLRFAPPLEYREPFWFPAFDPAWAARNKANGFTAGGDEERGGRHVYEGFVHTFYALIPPEKYFQDHPEWFSEINGARTASKRPALPDQRRNAPGTGHKSPGAVAGQSQGDHRFRLAERLPQPLRLPAMPRRGRGRRRPVGLAPPLRQRRRGRHRRRVPPRHDRYAGIPIHPQAAAHSPSAGERHRLAVQHRMLVQPPPRRRAQQGFLRRSEGLVENRRPALHLGLHDRLRPLHSAPS